MAILNFLSHHSLGPWATFHFVIPNSDIQQRPALTPNIKSHARALVALSPVCHPPQSNNQQHEHEIHGNSADEQTLHALRKLRLVSIIADRCPPLACAILLRKDMGPQSRARGVAVLCLLHFNLHRATTFLQFHGQEVAAVLVIFRLRSSAAAVIRAGIFH